MRTRHLLGGIVVGLALAGCARDWDSFEFGSANDAGDGGQDAPAVDAPAVDAPAVDAPAVDAPAADAPDALQEAHSDARDDAPDAGDAAPDASFDASEEGGEDVVPDSSEAGDDAPPDVADDAEAAADVTVDQPEAGDAPIENDSSASEDAQDAAAEEAGCPVDTKDCLGTCVPLDDPATGCGSVACWACPTPAHAVAACSASNECTIGACTAPWKNCNGDTSDGCESNSTNDVGNCGACGKQCAFPHAGASCAGGVCALGTCEIGFNDCDGDDATGCEANLKIDPENCGACGKVCPGGALALCTDGLCGLSSCPTGTANCDGQAANGCEVQLGTDVANCGFCGNQCSFANAQPGCASSSCVIAWCTGGFGNCDNVTDNGCEINLATSVSNCGNCGKQCSSVGGQASCSAGTCQIACTGSNADCDADVSNGCEANLSTSMQNCGACGTACPATAAHATVSCDHECLLHCATGFADCDRNINNGCEAAAKDYSAVVLADAPVGYWRLGEKSGTLGADASGHGSTLTYVNSPLLGRPGARPCDNDTAILFESANASHATMPRNPTVDPKGSALTIEYWVMEQSPLKAGVRHLWYGDSNNISAAGACWGFGRDPADASTLQGSVKTSAGGLNLGCTNCVKLGAWHHVAITYDGGKVTLYVNGVIKIEYPLAGTPKCTGASGLRIGGSNLPGDWVDALVDEVAVYDKALTAARLLAHYQAGI